LLAYVVLPGGRDLGYQELTRGYARAYVYDRPFQRLAAYRRAERAGRASADSIWRGCNTATAVATPSGRCDPSYPGPARPAPFRRERRRGRLREVTALATLREQRLR